MAPDRQPAGWYRDPAGVPNRLRFWDGQSWQPATTFDPATPLPTTVGAAPGQPSSSPRRAPIWILVGVGVVAVGLVLALVVVPRINRPDPEPPMVSDPPVSAPTTPGTDGSPAGGDASPGTPGGGAAGDLNCAGGNQVTVPHDKGRPMTTSGVTIEYPQNWPIRYSKTSWTFLDDLASWGRWDRQAKWAGGVTVGALPNRLGFTDAQVAAEEQVLRCLRTYGDYKDAQYYPEDPKRESSQPVTVSGMAGWQTTWTVTGADGKTQALHIVVLDAGQPQKLAAVIGFAPTDVAEVGTEVKTVLAGIKKA